ncbi:MAG: hypothetical protein V4484_03825 [Pseudomonadota bacterium]
MKHVSILAIVCLFTACQPKATPTADDKVAALASGNTMNCLVGDLKLAGSGPDEVGIGGFGINKGMLNAFSLSLDVEHGGKAHIVSTSLMPLPMQAGTYHFPSLESPGMSFAYYEIKTTKRDLVRAYNAATYSDTYSPIENDPEAKLKFELDKMTVSVADLPGFKRVHAVGRFQFNGAALPGAEPSSACMEDGIKRSIASLGGGKRLLPKLDAAVCGAEKKHIACDFDVSSDFVVQP